jgi:hypothetical protein
MPGSPSSDAHTLDRVAESVTGSPVNPASDDAHVRRRLLWLSGVPAAVTALLCVTTAGYLWTRGNQRSDTLLIVVYIAAAALLVATAVLAVRLFRRVEDQIGGLHSSVAEARSDLAEARSEVADARSDLDRLAERLRQADERRPPPVRTSAGRQVEVFVNLSRRLQSLVHREIKLLDALENEVEDPDLLKGLFQVDHLATRIRRHAENLAVLGGAVSRRQWSRPVALTEVLRSAIAEVEHYSRVKLVPPIDGTVPGHAVAGIIHLVAELIENATMFASPQTQVLLRAQQVAAGVAVEVEDRGLGMQRADQERVNRLLANPDDINLDELLQDGRIGLFVVSVIARQYGVIVRLQTNIYGGTQAVVILPNGLLNSSPTDGVSWQQALSHNTVELARGELTQVQLSAPPTTWPAFTARSALPTSAPAVVAGSRDNRLRPVVGTAQPMTPDDRTSEVAVTDSPALPAAEGPSEQRWPTDAGRPPLPQRHSQTHLVPQLQLPPRPVEEPAGEADPGLMASFIRGTSRSDEGAEADPVPTNRIDGNGQPHAP